jgi:hypothetical protein
MSYKVVASLAIATDQSGRHRNYYHGAVIPWLSEKQEKHFLRLKLVEKIAEPVAHKPEPVEHNESKPAPKGKPAKTAPEAAWVDYAVSQGFSEAEAKGKSKQELIEALG